MPLDTHVIIDFGPGLVTAIGLFIAAVPGILAAYFAYSNGKAIKVADGKLALALAKSSNPSGESKLTITPLASPEGKAEASG